MEMLSLNKKDLLVNPILYYRSKTKEMLDKYGIVTFQDLENAMKQGSSDLLSDQVLIDYYSYMKSIYLYVNGKKSSLDSEDSLGNLKSLFKEPELIRHINEQVPAYYLPLFGGFLRFTRRFNNMAELIAKTKKIDRYGRPTIVEHANVGTKTLERIVKAVDFYETHINNLIDEAGRGELTTNLFFLHLNKRKQMVNANRKAILTFLCENSANLNFGAITASQQNHIETRLANDDKNNKTMCELLDLVSAYITPKEAECFDKQSPQKILNKFIK